MGSFESSEFYLVITVRKWNCLRILVIFSNPGNVKNKILVVINRNFHKFVTWCNLDRYNTNGTFKSSNL